MFELSPGFEAMDGDGKFSVGSDGELFEENFFLIGEIGIAHPAVEADFAE